jgi:hypothetical protein
MGVLCVCVCPEDPKDFTRWYLSMFPAISKNIRNGKVRYKDLLLSLSMLAVDASVRYVSPDAFAPMRLQPSVFVCSPCWCMCEPPSIC